jgi:hypothetical protein
MPEASEGAEYTLSGADRILKMHSRKNRHCLTGKIPRVYLKMQRVGHFAVGIEAPEEIACVCCATAVTHRPTAYSMYPCNYRDGLIAGPTCSGVARAVRVTPELCKTSILGKRLDEVNTRLLVDPICAMAIVHTSHLTQVGFNK